MDAHLRRTNQRSPHDSNTLTTEPWSETSAPSEDQPYTSRGPSDAGELDMELRSCFEAAEYTVIWSQTLGGSFTSPVTHHFPCQAILTDDRTTSELPSQCNRPNCFSRACEYGPGGEPRQSGKRTSCPYQFRQSSFN